MAPMTIHCKKIKVLIVDDSAVARHLMTEILKQAGDIDVVGTAQDPIFAMKKIGVLKPDVVTLDVEMPRMDGITFLRELMRTDPVPVVMISAATRSGCEATITSLELGAVDYVPKPNGDGSRDLRELSDEIIRKVRNAAYARVRTMRRANGGPRSGRPEGRPASQTAGSAIIAIGASTGGTQAVTEIISALPETCPGIVIAQHMPPLFTRAFSERLNNLSRPEVREARDGDRIARGSVLIAPGDRHLTVVRRDRNYYTALADGPPINFVRPSVDMLFRSVAAEAGGNALGILLTGMGEDGARGLLEMRSAGARTVAQDEATSVVYGMPRKAAELGAAEAILPLEDIPGIIAGM